MAPLSREQRLQKLMQSPLFGGAEAPVPSPGTAAAPAPPTRARSVTAPKRAPPARARSTGPARSAGGPARVATVSRGGYGGSSLRNTTEAYRQQRGTTAKTIDAVGRRTMTTEKAQQVDRARKIVHGEAPTRGGSGPKGNIHGF
mmetsp:Transcript_29501/g.75628  ORF Transcript_29501/g.75628 Transcript_29501/m.75628 type:complete len:144 (+) Transcript_29501:53-484(+)